jgi:hypothetical protein
MTRKVREFTARPEIERNLIMENTWCDICQKVDIGFSEPVEFEENGIIFVEGKCRRCGKRVVSEVAQLHRR